MDLVISPTLNERENVKLLAEAVLDRDELHLLIVDDDSADRTWEVVQNMASRRGRLHLLRRMENHGFGASYIDGFRWALDHGADTIFTMDCDLSHPPQSLPALLAAVRGGADVAVGSRYVKGGGIENWPRRRLLISRSANLFAKLVTGLPVRDCTAGFMAIRAQALRAIDFMQIKCSGYGFLVELKFMLWRSGAALVEVPIVFRDREHGKTKFHGGMIGEAMKTCFRLRFSRRREDT